MINQLFDITGRIALVTGSSKGIGRALAQGLLESSAIVVLNGRDEAALARTRAELAEITGSKPYVQAFDVTDPSAVAAGIVSIEENVGPIEILVNNTGAQH
ncbi:MAG: SDR family NAD(P)-dependent oxidoreductase, partial [Nocardioidaceae bacterium]